MNTLKAESRHLQAFLVYAKQCADDGLSLYASTMDDHQAYFKKRLAYAQGKQLPVDWPPITTYFYIESNQILGSIRVRHGSNESINNITGHIGFETLATARGKGIASTMLNWVLTHVIKDSAIITCSETNIASKRVIEKSQAEYLGRFYDQENKQQILRYQLHSKK